LGILKSMDQVTTTLPFRSVVSSHPTTLERIEPYALSILRILVGLLFCEHGTAKLFGFPPHGPIQHFPDLEFFAGSIECFGGALLALGLFSRVVAFLMSGEMAIGYFMMHAPKSFFPLLNAGEAAVLFCFIFLFLAVAGPGPLCLDAVLWRRRA
jgi:putative oxidoreductase